MEYGEKFKKSVFGGFNRQNVLQCIEELNARSAEELEAKEAEKEQLEAQVKDLEARLDVQRKTNEELMAQKEARVEELEEAQSGKKAGFEIGEMMVEAKKTADSIVNRASRQADAAHTVIEAETAGISARLAEIRAQLSAAGEDFKVYSGNILRSLEEMQRTIEESRQRLAQPVKGPKKDAGKAAGKGNKDPYGFLFQK